MKKNVYCERLILPHSMDPIGWLNRDPFSIQINPMLSWAAWANQKGFKSL